VDCRCLFLGLKKYLPRDDIVASEAGAFPSAKRMIHWHKYSMSNGLAIVSRNPAHQICINT
jgi:hypothetical protein